MKREHWTSKVGFMWAAIGSAVGLGSIWRFPYIVGQNGGALFVMLFAFFLFFISLPVLIAEIVIGRRAQLNPYGAFRELGKSGGWGAMGLMTVITGFIISSFYSVICGWTLGYLIEAILGRVTHFSTLSAAVHHFDSLVASPLWALSTHLGMMLISTLVLYLGVRKGIEAWNKVLMPLLFIILIMLVIKGITLPGASAGLAFLFTPNWHSLTPSVVIMALGQALFTLSIGQGTMVTYGSYLDKKSNILSICLPIVLAVTLVSLLAGMAIFTVVFSVGAEPSSGSNLMFQTLPMVFSKIAGGQALAIAFFLLIFMAGLTSQISAMEPVIAYLIDYWGWKRHKSVICSAMASFLLGVPSALSFGLLSGMRFTGVNFFDAVSYLSINVLVPLGGLSAVLLFSWRWGNVHAFAHLNHGSGPLYDRFQVIPGYLKFSIKYLSPLVILLILLNLLGFL